MNHVLLAALQKILGQPDRDDRTWANFNCPYCAGKRKFGVNLETGATYCFKCGSRPDLRKLFREFGTTLRLDRRKSDLAQIVFERIRARLKRAEGANPISLEHWRRLPCDDMSAGDRAALRYAVKRGADPKRWEYGVFDEDRLGGRVAFLIRQQSVAMSYQARDYTRLGWPKTLNPPAGEGAPIGDLVFGLEHARTGDDIAIGEGIFDAVTLSLVELPDWRVCGCALLGKNASQVQIDQIVEVEPRRVVVCLDPDARKEALAFHKRLIEAGINAYVVDWGETSLDDDPNSLGPEECARRIQSATNPSLFARVRMLSSESDGRRDLRWRRTNRNASRIR